MCFPIYFILSSLGGGSNQYGSLVLRLLKFQWNHVGAWRTISCQLGSLGSGLPFGGKIIKKNKNSCPQGPTRASKSVYCGDTFTEGFSHSWIRIAINNSLVIVFSHGTKKTPDGFFFSSSYWIHSLGPWLACVLLFSLLVWVRKNELVEAESHHVTISLHW